MKSRKEIREMIIEELLNDDAMFSKHDVPGESNQELMSNIPEGATLEPWMESKITTAQDALDAVYESLFARIEKNR